MSSLKEQYSLKNQIEKTQKALPEVGNATLAAIRAVLDSDNFALWWDEELRAIDKARLCNLAGFPEGAHVEPWRSYTDRDRALMKRALIVTRELLKTMPGVA